MKARKLGKTDIEVSAIGLGCMSFTILWCARRFGIGGHP